MSNDDYSDDATELARLPKPAVDEATIPVQSVPAAVRKQFDADIDDATVERAALKAPPPSFDPDATHEQAALKPPPKPAPRPAYEEDATVLRPAGDAPQLQPRPSAKLRAGLAKKDQTTQEARLAPPERPRESPRLMQAPMLEPRTDPADTAEQLKRLGLTRRKRANANHVRPNSGFYSLPEANLTVGVDATVVGSVTFADDNREAIGLLVGLSLGLFAGLGLTTYAIARWSPPGEMLGVSLLIMIVCSILTAGFLLPRENLRLADLKGALIPVGINAALILIAALSWQIGTIRGALRPFASEAATMSLKVLDDRSHGVAVAECVRIASKLDARAYREAAVSALVGRDEILARCTQELDAESANRLTTLLVSSWQAELMGEAVDGNRACALADSMTALDRPPGDIETRMLACVLNAPTTNVQSCCGVSLVKRVAKQDNWLATVRSSDGFDASDEATAVGLMTLAFHQQGVTGSQQEFVNAAKFDGPAGRRLALSFACDAIADGADRLSQHFSASLGKCAIDEARVPQSREVWANVCDDALARVANAEEPSKALCAATRVALVGHAVSDASRIVSQAAKDRSQKRDLAIAIDVEANTSRGSLQNTFRKLDSWGEDYRKRHEAQSGPSFKPDW